VPDPIVDTVYGPVRGREEDGIAVFRGVPFAAPPIGERRFAPPVAHDPWVDVRDAVSFGASAPQNPSVLEEMLGGDNVSYSEDCLTLNVWTPACDLAARPVMVWIHGGAFVTGSGSIPWYDGARLARRDAVIVTINYRLGVLGYLHLEQLADGFDGSGNAGLLDQVAALAWVRDNIAAFGGNPANVTVFGESAGAMSIGTLLGTPAADGLFGRAVLQSGAASHIHDASRATEVARKFLAEAGTDAAGLRSLPLADVLAAQQRLADGTPFEAGLPLQPVVDGTVVPQRPLERVAMGGASAVDLLVGTTLEEMKMFLLMEPSLGQLDADAMSAAADKVFVPAGRQPGEGFDTYRRRLSDASLPDVWSAVLTDRTFRMPAIRLVEAQLAHRPDVWMYLFTLRSTAFKGALGACHALEIPFVWDNLAASGAEMFIGGRSVDHDELARRMADAWVAFARDCVPSADGLPDWPMYDTERRATLRLDAAALEVVDDPMAPERQLWDGAS
jgi:para-nitrobenzyl esterase